MKYFIDQIRQLKRLAKKTGSDRRGVSLLEAMVALLVLMVGIVGGMVLMISTTMAARISHDQLMAANLAREGVEIVRSIRDSNWLKIEAGELNSGVSYKWDDGLYEPSNHWYGAYPHMDDTTKIWSLVYTNVADGADIWKVRLDGRDFTDGGLFNQYAVVPASPEISTSKYTRKIFTYPICSDGTTETVLSADGQVCGAVKIKVGVQVTAVVKWYDNNQTRTTSVEARLYNWK
jgi:hypothetical protein